ncbi:bifunctional (p)ppGpp synthetase/guanosine-3',5'-bis(diphosphate) 3'-pyrophosphohydrolase [Candidatus Peribacteria bacterium]|nr:bifunctional (p)ppGpp synthetase/guanosine-3',5'-bis(diphosphate) 3'-pyrophosphohydrolase [Candidatus Peribacteria bacterium]MBT4021077.1 bifunctional (p)ppGpp synthetase/guanosine-3',5'-bis(diphosphate) 3'-pyrophosphohydrolase [Candidatus Peribacteria bacterium]MBT4240798.1 bifunctional (p)ppGpp synthetase/guanosine-3',5'-bis(diphosphate) 3'-pyrophosphohydrolase [Candidatus Peribacteria bacterium]MBT4474173.1 bifunctional (p)ppGpp synthetase/guanosine-3',5'-bis(diphosphate) 3'-pyrophosphohyd
METILELLRRLNGNISKKEVDDLKDAYEMSCEIYGNEQYITGEYLSTHVKEVTKMLLPMHPETKIIISALLQHVRNPEDLRKIEKRFGKDVRRAVASLGVLENECRRSHSHSKSQLNKMLLALSEDVRVLIICLHDHAHVLNNSHHMEHKAKIGVAREILEVFAPLCAKLGIYSLKYTLENRAFSILYPQEAEDIEKSFEAIHRKNGNLLPSAELALTRTLKSEGIECEISHRKKYPYSIFRKMHKKGITNMVDLYDLFGTRVLVDSVEDCYRVLGILHRTYRPILHRIKDYIGMPKPNGYRSLHTTLLGLSSESLTMPVEVQIRTNEMDKEAEYGIAAHWNYEKKGSSEPLINKMWSNRMQRMHAISNSSSMEEEDIHEEIADRIYVLTPKGDPIELRKDSTPLDFAFQIHSDIGLKFKMAKVNGAVAPIDHHLENGDVVEILVRKNPTPSEQWISICRTKDARARLRAFFHDKPNKKIGARK